MANDPYAAIRKLIAEYDSSLSTTVNGDGTPYDPFLDWPSLADEDDDITWLVDGMWPQGRSIVLYALQKTGKSLVSLHIAACLALGQDPFTGKAITPHDVCYLDYEMTRADVQERLIDMGHYHHMKAGDLKRLHYALHPPTAPMDTSEGGKAVLAMVEQSGSDVVVIDTLARVIKGDENSADTFRAFALHTGQPLKARGVSVMRLDHEGKSKEQGMRGSSAKGDDPDITYRLSETDRGYLLTRGVSRYSYSKADRHADQCTPVLG